MIPTVCMCLYQRPNNFPKILERLERQSYKYFSFLVWCNAPEYYDYLCNEADKYSVDTKIYPSNHNKGSKARFWLVNFTVNNPIIMFDDDQLPQQDFVYYMLKEYIRDPKAVKSWKSRKFENDSYWNSKGVEKGEEADYLGTGGMVVGREILMDKRVQNIPEVCSNTEDLYLSYVARVHYQYKLIKIKRKLEKHEDGLNQHKKLKKEKEECFRYLRDCGFNLLIES